MNHVLKPLIFVAALAIALACIGPYLRDFDIEWDEEVQLHDGRTIVVHIRRSYTRTSMFSRWQGIQRDTEISFDAGGKIGRFTRNFARYDVDFIESKNGYWYIYLLNTTGTPPEKLVDWNAAFLILAPDGTLRKASSWNELPIEFKRRNIMPPSPDSKGIAKFNGTLLMNSLKQLHWREYPAGAGDDGILRRPYPASMLDWRIASVPASRPLLESNSS